MARRLPRPPVILGVDAATGETSSIAGATRVRIAPVLPRTSDSLRNTMPTGSRKDIPGEGHILVFNNGNGRPDGQLLVG